MIERNKKNDRPNAIVKYLTAPFKLSFGAVIFEVSINSINMLLT